MAGTGGRFSTSESIHSNRSTTIRWCHGIGGGSRGRDRHRKVNVDEPRRPVFRSWGVFRSRLWKFPGVNLRRNRPPRGKAASFSGSRPGLDARRLEKNLFITSVQVSEHLCEQVLSEHNIASMLVTNKNCAQNTYCENMLFVFSFFFGSTRFWKTLS